MQATGIACRCFYDSTNFPSSICETLNMTTVRFLLGAALLALLLPSAAPSQAAEGGSLELKKGDHVVLIGNTLAERMQDAGYFEALLHSRFPQLELVVRNLGWSADGVDGQHRLRSQDFQDHGNMLRDHNPDVVLGFFGFNESFAGPEGIESFKADLTKLIADLRAVRYGVANYNRGAQSPKIDQAQEPAPESPQLILFSPIAHEDLGNANLLDGSANNKNLELYTQAMAEVAEQQGVRFVDLYTPSKKLMAAAEDMTINGVHLNDDGYRQLAPVMDEALFGPRPQASAGTPDLEKLRAEVLEKNLQFWYDYRAINGFYIYGGRKNPFGVVNFPDEFAKLRKMIANRDQRIWAVAQGKAVPEEIDDSNTGALKEIETNFKAKVHITPPEEAQKKFKLPEGYEINLFASEVEFPELENPVQFAWDAEGRLWVVTMPSYPMYLPGTPVNDKVLIFEDTDGDGRADKQTVFADGLHVPTGIELGDGGVYVAQQPNLVFLKDTDGDDKADTKEVILHGFDSADSHHSISAFTWGPGGALYFEEGTFHHTQVETPYGPQRCANAGVFRYEPRTEKFNVFVSYSFANPWGHVFDRWGQNFVADASGGANYFGAAFSGSIDHPQKHGGMKQFLVKQWRPTAGCEIVSSSNFPDEAQGNYLLNNCIGFQGVLQYKFKDEGSGFFAEPVEPLLKSDDPNFRPVDIEFGPDGALYVVDWFNPLVGHMQHSLRDPNRDKNHGRIWRISYTKKPLAKPVKIAGEPIPVLLELLKTYQDRDRYRVRRELRSRDTSEVVAQLDKWIAGLDKNDSEHPHHLLEALWVKQHHNVVDEGLLKQLLASPEPRARAAATRVLCYQRDRVQDSLVLLQQKVNDEHPRVRLEAVRALSFFRGDDVPEAQAIALESLLYDQDVYLQYVLKETNRALDARAKASQ